MNQKQCGAKQTWSNLRYYPGISLIELEKNMKWTMQIVDICAHTQTRILPNMKNKYYPHDDNIHFTVITNLSQYGWIRNIFFCIVCILKVFQYYVTVNTHQPTAMFWLRVTYSSHLYTPFCFPLLVSWGSWFRIKTYPMCIM